ncbi:MAG: VCBS repeat-containing protein [Thermoanaerobaculia bacterium]
MKRLMHRVRIAAVSSPAFEKAAPSLSGSGPRVVTGVVGLLSLLVVLSLAPAVASAQVTWTQAMDVSSKPATRQPIAFDSKRGVVVAFGGCSEENLGVPLGDTWEWNGAKWKMVSTSGPSPRQSRAMAYDSAREVMVLFGGLICDASAPDNFTNDTWEWDGKEWSQAASTGPSPRVAPMVYDSAREVSVLFGGVGSVEFDDTWEWDGESWTQVSSTGPGLRYNVVMAYDERRGVSVLFGGVTGGLVLGDTWEWDGESWSQVGVGGPPARNLHSMAYDSRRGVVVLFGGVSSAQQSEGRLDDTWEWNGKRWKQVNVGGPPSRRGHALAYDAARGQMLLFGGSGVGGDLGDTWILSPGVSAAGSDYNGEGTSDLAVYNSTTYRWKVRGERKKVKFGAPNALPVPGDYDGDGRTDRAYFDAVQGLWKVRNQFTISEFGQAGDLPAPGDYDGDGKTDPAFFRPSTGTWHIADAADIEVAAAVTVAGAKYSSLLVADEVTFGQMGDVPIPGDYDGDGVTDLAIYRPSKRLWIVKDQKRFKFGKSGSIPVAADYDGNGKTDIAVWNPKTGKWLVRRGGKARFGRMGDIPVPGDYDGDGAADFAVYDPATRLWMVRGQFEKVHGKPGELPLVGGR